MSAVLSPPPGSRPCIACGRLPRWAGEANDAEGFCPGCLDPEGSETGLTPAEFFEAGHLAAIRAEVTYALANMEQEAGEAARVERNWRFFLARPSGLDPWNRAQFVGLRHMAERRRRRAVGFLATTRRWLQETA